MPTVIPANHADCAVILSHSDLARPAAITFGVERTTPADNAQAVADAVQNVAAAELDVILDSQVTIGPTLVTYTNTSGVTASTTSATALGQGAAVVTNVPPNVALIVNKRSLLPGRKGRGRWFVPWGMAEADVGENGRLTASFITSRNTQLQTILNAFTTAGVGLVILHDSASTPVPPPSLITDLLCGPIVRTQRRRLPRR